MEANKLSLVIIIVNSGYSDDIMSVVKENGARGGTIIEGVGSARKEAEKLYGITIHPEKEVILVIVAKEIKNQLLKAIYTENGKKPVINAVAFSLPIEKATSNLVAQYQ